jgi:hypothetical protein
MITFFNKAGDILATNREGNHEHKDLKEYFDCDTGRWFYRLGQVEYVTVRYDEDFEKAFKILGSQVRPSSVAGKEVYTFVGDEARTIAANLL